MGGALTRMLGSGSSAGAGGSFLFDGVNDYIEITPLSPVTAYPCTMVCWFKPNGTTGTSPLAYGNGTTGRYQINLDTAVNIQITNAAGTTPSTGASVGSISTGVWQLCGGIWLLSNSRTPYYGSTAGTTVTSSSSATVSAWNTISIGHRRQGGVRGLFFDGRIAHVAIWDIALSGADWTNLAAGTPPSSVQASNLKFYAPLTGGVAVDTISGNPLTVSGAVSDSDGPF